MARRHGLRKITEGAMKSDAQFDYVVVKEVCERLQLPIVIPKGKSAWKIEDATAEMLQSIPANTQLNLLKGLSYYASIRKH